MSYCRWSTDDFQCDLYCYEDVSGGYTTHVAGRRRKYLEPLPPADPQPEHGNIEAWIAWAARQIDRLRLVQQRLENLQFEWEELPTPDGGEWTFNDPDLPSFLARLLDLRRQGFQFPDYVLDAVRKEMAEQGQPGGDE